ncbi:MAG: hypothetical protein M0R06_10280 [Sphaerochaeta sp.]|jgi:hypothetical protein|nr:hypothetical protein [Sphaerochaeta sp.]
MEKNFALFKDVIIKAPWRQIDTAARTLTPVEFRMWINACEKFGSFDPSHFAGQEAQFIATGKWDWVPVEGGK